MKRYVIYEALGLDRRTKIVWDRCDKRYISGDEINFINFDEECK